MRSSRFQTFILSIAGFTAVLIGSYIALDPAAFYAAYGVELEGKTDFLSELRAPGTNLAVLGVAMLLGVIISRLRTIALACSLMVFSSFAAGRVLGIAADGWPSQQILVALFIEVLIAALCWVAFSARGATTGMR